MDYSITILGCGASAGVPLIGCECDVCRSDNPKNKRLRASILIQTPKSSLLVDASPDLRQQALQNRFKHLDALLITHAHADHCHGIDEMRSFNYHADAVLPIYADKPTMDELKHRFSYVFQPPAPKAWYRAALLPYLFEDKKPFLINDLDIIPFKQLHGPGVSYGLKFGNIAYSTDVLEFPASSKEYLYNLDVWIVDCMRYDPAPTHAHFDLTMQWIEEFKPKRAILTHMNHDMDYDSLCRNTPYFVEPAFDGMVLNYSY